MQGDFFESESDEIGAEMHQWIRDLFPICRSITGPGFRQSLAYISKLVNDLKVYAVPSGSRAFDWIIPEEWSVNEAWIKDEDGTKVIDFAECNLHLVGYSEPIDQVIDLDELQMHLHSREDRPTAIPYVTSYYERRWGFCLSHNKREALRPGSYHAFIDSKLSPGTLNYGEVVIPGSSEKEVLLSTYLCHPSMANNELSGPAVTTALVRWLQSQKTLRYTYRVVFVPETIGSLAFLSGNLDYLSTHVMAGFNITCVGDERTFSYLPSRDEHTISDDIAKHVLRHVWPTFDSYSWLDRGSDERQYCAPGIDLPIASIMRSKYGTYPEYHTSDDDLTLVTPKGLLESFLVLRTAIEIIERNIIPVATTLGEPQLGRRGLYQNLSGRPLETVTHTIRNLLTYSDGEHTLLEIADLIGEPFWSLSPIVEELREFGLIQVEAGQNKEDL